MPLSYAKVISCSAICKHKGEGAWGGCTRARAESWCPVAGPMAVGGALPAGGRTARRGAQGALAGGHHPYLVRDLPSESHPCPCGGEKAHVEHGGCRGGQWAGGRATGGSVPDRTVPPPPTPAALAQHPCAVATFRTKACGKALAARPVCFLLCWGEKKREPRGNVWAHRSTAASPQKAPSDLRKRPVTLQPQNPVVASDNCRAINTSVPAL